MIIACRGKEIKKEGQQINREHDIIAIVYNKTAVMDLHHIRRFFMRRPAYGILLLPQCGPRGE